MNISNVYGCALPENGFAVVDAAGTFVNSAAYGVDKVVKSYVEDFNGKPAWKTEVDPAKGASKNSYKWPGVTFTNCLFSTDALTAKKEEGFTKIVVPLYIESSSATTKDLCWDTDLVIDTVNCNEWVNVEISIDEVISRYSTIGTYFFYVENSASADYITYYVSDAYFA